MQQSLDSVPSVDTAAPSRRLGFAAPLLVVTAVLLGHVALLYRATVSHTDGSFCYPLDDTFIHMAIGRTIAEHGVFGVTPHEFAAASSSLLWPVLLALVDLIAGDRLLTPLVLNVVIGCGLVAYIAHVLQREAPRSTAGHRTFWAAAAVVLAPMPTIVFIGMEHTLHVLVSLALLIEATRWLANDQQTTWKRLAALSVLVTAVRYEGAFLVGVIGALAMLRRRFKPGGALWALGALPIVSFGLYSMAKGGLFLPNSVVVKGNRVHFHDLSDVGDFFGGTFIHRMCIEPHVLAAMIVAALALLVSWQREGRWAPSTLRLGISLAVGTAHVQFASLNWFFRYEAYLVVMLVMSVGLYVLELAPSFVSVVMKDRVFAAAALFVSFVGLGALGRRALFAAEQTPSASRNIYDQQVQNARFLKKYFPDEPVAINDIGAVAYYGRQPIVDLVGLASLPVARAKKLDFNTPLAAEDIARFTEKTDVAIVYDDWFPGNLPKTWIRAGRWRLDWCKSCGSPVVSIYATRPEALDRVVRSLRDFAAALPEDVRGEGRYVAAPAEIATRPEQPLQDGDVVRIDVPFANKAMRRRYSFVAVIGGDGRFAYPYSDPIVARGLTTDRLAEGVAAAFAKIRDKDHELGEAPPSVKVTIVRRTALHYTVAGNVFSPGELWTDVHWPAAHAVALAGGPDYNSSGARPFLLREANGKFERIEFDLPKGDAADTSPELAPLDVIFVP